MNNKMSKKKTKRPNKAIYYIFGFILTIISFFRRQVRITFKCTDGTILEGKDANIMLTQYKPPFIIVGNHHSLYDYVYLVRAFYPHRINFIIARKLYLASKYHFLIKMARAIPKSLFQPDVQTIRQSFDILGNNGILAMYPEGQIIINGITKDMPENSAKLIKKMGLPVFAVRTSGAYFCDSTWRKTLIHGIINVEISIKLTPEQIKSKTVDEIDEIIKQSIYVDNFADQERTGNLYKGQKRAQGLENILYRCPCCGTEFSIQTKKNTISCSNCNMTVLHTEAMHLDWGNRSQYYSHIGEWYLDQRAIEKKRQQDEKTFFLEFPVELRILSESYATLADKNNSPLKKTHGIEKAGDGVFTLTANGYSYKGTFFGEHKELFFNPHQIRYIPYTPGSNLQIYVQDVMYAFHPKDSRMCAKIALTIETYFEVLLENSIKSEAVV